MSVYKVIRSLFRARGDSATRRSLFELLLLFDLIDASALGVSKPSLNAGAGIVTIILNVLYKHRL